MQKLVIKPTGNSTACFLCSFSLLSAFSLCQLLLRLLAREVQTAACSSTTSCSSYLQQHPAHSTDILTDSSTKAMQRLALHGIFCTSIYLVAVGKEAEKKSCFR